MTIRVIQWATGPVGSVQLAEVIANPDPIAHFGDVSGGFVAGDLGPAAVPYMLKAPPHVVIPEVLGAYRWPGAAAIG